MLSQTIYLLFKQARLFILFSTALCLGSPKVVVVGAGLAGLTVAYRLQEKGINVELYEARQRVGGRILTADVRGRTVELGGQNINDGGEAIYLRRLIDELGLPIISRRIGLSEAYFNGDSLILIKDALKEKNFEAQDLKIKIDQLALYCHSMKEILENFFDEEDPLYHAFAMKLASYEGGSIEQLSPLYSETLFQMLLGGLCSAHQASIKEETFVNFTTIQGGNAQLCEKIAERLGSHLHLNKPLKKVVKQNDVSFSLKFQNGEEIQADVLVLAIPCSVYQHIIFEEEVIPIEKLDTIYSIQYGQNAKIIVPFTPSVLKTNMLINDRALSFFDETRQILTVYHTGETSLFSPETVGSAYMQARPMIEMGFGKESSPFEMPIYARDQSFVSYDGPVGYSWPNDPYAGGTYSYVSKGQEEKLMAITEEKGEIFRELFAPIGGNLYFAGEHTSILFDVPGTMETACESGERVARVILKGLNDETN
jgi:monoamine oxidase